MGARGRALTWTWPNHACPAVDAGQPGGYQLLPSPASSSCPPARDSTGWEELGHLRAPWSSVRPLWNVSMAILACGQLEPLLNLNGGTEPKNAGDTGEKFVLRNRILVWSPCWPQRCNPLVPAFQAEGLQMHASVPCFWSHKPALYFVL